MSQTQFTSFQQYLNYELEFIEKQLNPYAYHDVIPPLPILSTPDLLKIDGLLNDTENAILTPITNKLTQSVNSINSNVDSAEFAILSKVSNSTSFLNTAINNIKNDIKFAIGFTVDDINDNTNLVGNKILTSLNQKTNDIVSVTRQVESNISKLLTGIALDTSESIDKQTFVLREGFTKIDESILSNTKSLLSGLQHILQNISVGRTDEELLAVSQQIIDYFNTENSASIRLLLSDFIGGNLKNFIDSETVKNIFDVFSGGFNIIDTITKGTNPVTAVTDLFGGNLGQLVLLKIANTIIDNIINPYAQHIFNSSMSGAKSGVLSPAELVRLFYLGKLNPNQFFENMSYYGFSNENAVNSLHTARNYFNESEIRELRLRDIINDDTAKQLLKNINVLEEDYENKTLLWQQIPNIVDIIRMSVREAFSEDIVQEYGLDAEYPQVVDKWARRAGLAGELEDTGVSWAKMFWRSHWQPVSTGQAFEMFQRKVISRKELETALKVQDIVPKWREKLLQIAYSPIGRVDIRRIHAMGMIEYPELVLAYESYGLSPEDAKLVADWTVRYNARTKGEDAGNIRQLSMTKVIQYYKLGRFTETEAIARIVELGFPEQDARLIIEVEAQEIALETIPQKLRNNFSKIEKLVNDGFIVGTMSEVTAREYLAKINFTQEEIDSEISFLKLERETQLKQLVADATKDRFIFGMYDAGNVQTILSANRFSNEEINFLVNQWSLLRDMGNKFPSSSDLQKWLHEGIIEPNVFRRWMKGLGYEDVFIQLYEKENL